MLAVLQTPLPPFRLILAALGLSAAIALYCLGYSALAGRPEPVGEALAWVAVNILPWFLAIELGKRRRDWRHQAAILAAAFLGSLLLGAVAASGAFAPGFEAWRRVPALGLAALVLAGLHFAERPAARRAEAELALPLAPHQIDWASAAGNYVEFRGAGRTLIRRTSLTDAERELIGHGFVRIHRSTLVRRDRIARVRPADVILHDGTSLKTGKRYRAALQS